MRIPAALVALPVLAGVGIAVLFYDRLPDLFAFRAAAASLIALLAASASFACASGPECGVTIAIGSLLAGLSFGAGGAERAYGPSLLRWFESLPASVRDQPYELDGVLREDGTLTPFGTSLSIDVEGVNVRDPVAGPVARAGRRPGEAAGLNTHARRRLAGGVRLSLSGTIALDRLGQWRAGRRVRVAALLRTPSIYRNPGSPPDARGLARRGIVLVGLVKSGALVEVAGRGSAVREAAASARAWARAQLATFVGRWSARSGGVATAIVVGDRTGLSPDDERRLQEAGTYHVIAISGGNIALLTAIMLAGAGILRVPPRAAAGGAIAALLFYAEVTGAPASVARATSAAVIYLAGRLFDHRGPPLNALAVAAILAVAASPLTATDPGFLLSFGATLGILVLAPRLASHAVSGFSPTTPSRDGFSRTHVLSAPSRTSPSVVVSRFSRTIARTVRTGAMLLIATVCAEIALAPAGALLFRRITFAGLLLNFAAIPLMALVQTGSLLVLSLARPLPALALHVGYLTNLAARGLVDSARFVDVVPWIAVQVTPPSTWVVLVYYGACLAALATRHRAMSVAICGLALAEILVGRPTVAPAASDQLRVVFLDVGQGDATFVSMPDGCTLLVDTGGAWIGQPLSPPPVPDGMGTPGAAFDVGERVVVPALRALGARSLDNLVLTHGDPDHIGGAPAVLRRFAPRTIWEGVPVPPFEPMKLLARQASTSRAAWRIVQPGDFERHGAAVIRVLHPPPPDWERQRVRNDDSVVLDVRLGDVSVVLPGDIGAEGEREIIPRVVAASTVILKVPHHGSATSSTPGFLSALHPAVAVVSAGRDNRFGHPAPLVVARYREAGVRIFRTDVDGAVFVDTDGKTVWIRGWTGRRLTLPSGNK